MQLTSALLKAGYAWSIDTTQARANRLYSSAEITLASPSGKSFTSPWLLVEEPLDRYLGLMLRRHFPHDAITLEYLKSKADDEGTLVLAGQWEELFYLGFSAEASSRADKRALAAFEGLKGKLRTEVFARMRHSFKETAELHTRPSKQIFASSLRSVLLSFCEPKLSDKARGRATLAAAYNRLAITQLQNALENTSPEDMAIKWFAYLWSDSPVRHGSSVARGVRKSKTRARRPVKRTVAKRPVRKTR